MTAPVFVTSLAKFGDRVAFVDDRGKRLTYAALSKRVDTLAGRLGTDPQLVMIELASSISSVIAYLAALKSGHPVIVAKAGDAEAGESIFDCFQPSVVHIAGTEGFTDVHDNVPELHPDLAVLYSTSGSTGSAKLVRLSAQNLDANAESIATYLDVSGCCAAVWRFRDRGTTPGEVARQATVLGRTPG